MLCFCVKLRSHQMRQRHVFCIWMSKTFRTFYLCELSHQQRNNKSGLAARYKFKRYVVNTHKEIIRFYFFCSSKYKILVAVAFGGNAA